MEVIWIIPTTVQRFKTWFMEYFKQYEWKTFRADENETTYILFTIKPPRLAQVNDDKAYINVASEFVLYSEDKEPERFTSLWDAINIDVLQLQDEKIEFKGRFHQLGLKELYITILSAIRSRWPIEDLSSSEINPEEGHQGVTIKQRGPGRKSFPEDIWVINEIRKGRDSIEVKKEWSQMPGVIERRLEDPHSQFNRLKRRAKKTK